MQMEANEIDAEEEEYYQSLFASQSDEG